MADRDEGDLQMAIHMSLHGSPPGAKRSKPIEESPEARERSLQRELRAAAAERRMAMMTSGLGEATVAPRANTAESKTVYIGDERRGESSGQVVGDKLENEKEELSSAVVEQLFSMMFGGDVSAGILSRWSNQGIRFSPDHETSVGLVQHEGGPCGVLAAIQAFLLKYLIFLPEDSGTQSSGQKHLTSKPSSVDDLVDMPEDRKERALIHGMVEILFSCGNKERAAVATLNVSKDYHGDDSNSLERDEAISREFHGLVIESASDLQKVLKVNIFTSELGTFNWLRIELPVFRSRLGAMLFLISALLSRGLDSVQDDRDDPSLPLVTAPFGHASQEIVNLLLCGQAVPNVFDGGMDLGGGMSLKGIPGPVEVGFLTLLESLNFCKVGQHLKHPKWPIWVVGSESHYTVLFALDSSVQDENELEQRVSRIRRAFDTQDQSGGGGFISTDGFHKVLCEMGIRLPSDKLNSLCSSGYIVWSELWQVLLDLDKDCGGLKDSSTLGKKQFDIYHFNGIAKSILNGSQIPAGETPIQRPRLSKLSVVVPPSCVQEDILVDEATSISYKGASSDSKLIADQLHEPSQHAPLVDCIRTCWKGAICRWIGDPPSIV